MSSSAGRGSAEVDDRGVGSVFIDVLFAAVVTKALELSSSGNVSFDGRFHLALAAILTITSWIGYHNSKNRKSYKIVFFNLPLAQFAIEMAHVYLYWLIVSAAESKSTRGSVLPEALIIAVCFVLYIAWDQIALVMRRSDRFPDFTIEGDRPSRRFVTVSFLAGYIVVALIAVAVHPHQQYAVAGFDLFLACGLIAHRALQHQVSRDKVVASTPLQAKG